MRNKSSIKQAKIAGEYMFFILITMVKAGQPPKKSHHPLSTPIGLGTQQVPVMESNYKVKRLKDG